MTLPAPTYDLVLLIDPKAEDGVRAKIVSDSRSAIEANGELLRHDEWGERPLAYPIDKKASAEYHLLQFHAGSSDLLDGLDRTLRITDSVLRFRIIKLRPGVPDSPDMPAATVPAAEPTPTPEAPAPAAEAPQPAEAAPAGDEPAPAADAAGDDAAEAPDVAVAGPAA
jgi:small subunit ribosomal protein S6